MRGFKTVAMALENNPTTRKLLDDAEAARNKRRHKKQQILAKRNRDRLVTTLAQEPNHPKRALYLQQIENFNRILEDN